MEDAEFDRQLDEFTKTVTTLLKDTVCRDYFTTACLVYPDRIELQNLFSEDGATESYELLFGFGQHLKAQGTAAPPAVFVGADFEWMDGSPCIFVSGCAQDGRKNGAKLAYVRSRWRKRMQLTGVRPFYYRDRPVFKGRTYAGELMRGLTE